MAERGPVRIAVVDSGIDAAHPGVRSGPGIRRAIRIDGNGSAHDEPVGRDAIGHGTAVAATIRALSPEAELLPVRVLVQEPHCSIAVLAAALRCCTRLEVRLVNVSLGIDRRFDPGGEHARRDLAAAVAELLASGRRLVAPAATALGLPSTPGDLVGVDSVVADPNRERAAPLQRRVGVRAVWFASPFPPAGLAGLPALRVHGQSLAVANVTGHLATQPGAPA